MTVVTKCPCGGEPCFVEGCRGHKESVLLNNGRPDFFRIECPRCGYSTSEHKNPEPAIAEWDAHCGQSAHQPTNSPIHQPTNNQPTERNQTMRQEIAITGTIHDITTRNTASGGQIYRAYVAVKETGKKGSWVDEYPVTLFGSDLDGVTPSEGMQAKVTFFVKPFEWNGKHLVELRGTKVEPVAAADDGEAGRPVYEVPASAPAAFDDEDMPF